MKRMFRSGRYANVTSTLALVVALGGTSAYAANTIRSSDIVNGQVKRVDIANNAVNSGKVQNNSLRVTDFRAADRALLRGPAGANGANGANGTNGAKGDKGDKGDPGTPATRLWALVNAAGTLVAGSGATAATKLGTGDYRVTFDQSVAACISAGTATDVTGGAAPIGSAARIIGTDNRVQTDPATVDIGVTDPAGAVADPAGGDGFTVTVFC